MRLGLLICGQVAPAAQGPGGDYPQLFASLFADHDVSWVPVDLTAGERPGSARDADGWISTGSPSSVYDELAWMPDAVSFVRDLLEAEVPYVGDCFGHQMLAVALGGTVERAEIGWRVGVQRYRVTEPQPWMTPPAESFRLIASHQDQVTEVPPGATVFADGPLCPVAGLAYGSAISFQGHPEFTPELSRLLTLDRRARIGEDETRRGLASLDLGITQTLIADWIVEFVRRGGPGRTDGA